MRTKTRLRIASVLLVVLANGPNPARADGPPAQRPALFDMKPVGESALAGRRGGTQTVNDVKLRGVVANNQAVDVVTGGNSISDGAFSGAAGLPMVIQNTGNNVLIQNATVVNVKVQ
ncbi:hypothetical protein V4F39_17100 [Aquincola sp. MAHUQ-54]|uniref:Uncharacterized protein n=1 Tax=Aquincola agrisoli TaxID=3119538 RepID=A0AAW9QKR8_9BURK